jgi:UrcA family protein
MSIATMTTSFRRRAATSALVLAGCVLGALSTAQAAQPETGVPSVVVKYTDLDLTSDAGNVALYQRIAAAAKQVCPAGDSRDLKQFASSHACQATAIRQAVDQVSSPRLAAVRAAHSRHG